MRGIFQSTLDMTDLSVNLRRKPFQRGRQLWNQENDTDPRSMTTT